MLPTRIWEIAERTGAKGDANKKAADLEDLGVEFLAQDDRTLLVPHIPSNEDIPDF